MLLVSAIQLALSAGFITLFSWSYSFGRRFAVFHVLLIATIQLARVLGVSALVWIGAMRTRGQRRLFSTLVGVALATLFLLYAVDATCPLPFGRQRAFP